MEKKAHLIFYLQSYMPSVNLMGTSCKGICLEHQLSIFWFMRRGVYVQYTIFDIAVYDSDGSLIVKSCGATPPDLIISSSNSLKTVFKSDNARHYEGFKVSWTTTQNVNSIKSQNYPLPYHNDANEVNCYFSFKTRRYILIIFTFKDMDIGTCC